MEIVNGYPCKDCTDVDYAKKNIDPAHPKDGPFGVNNPQKVAQAARDKAIKFGGSLSDPDGDHHPAPTPTTSTGTLVDLRA